MSYTAKTWVTGEVIQAVDLNHAEQGIAEADAKATAISAPGAIGTANLAPAAVTNDKLDQEAVDSNNIRTGAIITPLIYDGAVTLAKLADAVKEHFALADYNDFKSEQLYDSFPHEPAKETPWAVTQNSSYVQLVFDNVHQQVVKPYIVRLVTDAAIRFTRIEFRNTSNAAVANVVVNGAATPKEPFYCAINPTGTAKISRIRFYGASNSANINLDFFDFVAIAKANINAVMSLDYISNLAVNKTATLSWIDDKYVNADNPNYLYDNSTYSVTNFDVQKGDIIRVFYPNTSHMVDTSKGVLSERVIYGSGEYEYGFRVIYRGQSTQREYVYVAERDMHMTVCGQNDNVSYLPQIYVYSIPAYAQSSEFAKERWLEFPYNETKDKLLITKASRNGYGGSTYPKPLSLLHYSDVHNGFRNVSAIKRFMDKYGSAIDDAICTGDMTGNKFPAYYPIYGLDDYKKILLCIGNHDVYDVNNDAESHGASYDNEAYWASNLQKYNQYFAPSIANWNVVQPSNAATLGLCYYYKDYSSNGYGYRLIVLDAMAFDNNQYAWLVSTLADAKTNSKTVVIADHFAPITGLSDINGFDTPFMSLLTGMEFNYSVSRLTAPNGSAANAVDDFINGGGEFACWLCGHMHYDQIGVTVAHPNQIFVAVGCANGSPVWADMPRNDDDESYNLFNIISIDPYYKTIKISRIGANVDDWGRKRDCVSVNYQTKTLIATS